MAVAVAKNVDAAIVLVDAAGFGERHIQQGGQQHSIHDVMADDQDQRSLMVLQQCPSRPAARAVAPVGSFRRRRSRGWPGRSQTGGSCRLGAAQCPPRTGLPIVRRPLPAARRWVGCYRMGLGDDGRRFQGPLQRAGEGGRNRLIRQESGGACGLSASLGRQRQILTQSLNARRRGQVIEGGRMSNQERETGSRGRGVGHGVDASPYRRQHDRSRVVFRESCHCRWFLQSTSFAATRIASTIDSQRAWPCQAKS